MHAGVNFLRWLDAMLITSISCEIHRTTNIGEYESVKTCAGASADIAPGECPVEAGQQLYLTVERSLVAHTGKALARVRRNA